MVKTKCPFCGGKFDISEIEFKTDIICNQLGIKYQSASCDICGKELVQQICEGGEILGYLSPRDPIVVYKEMYYMVYDFSKKEYIKSKGYVIDGDGNIFAMDEDFDKYKIEEVK